jgi:diguanylate cyclase (GGDEF)-like protein
MNTIEESIAPRATSAEVSPVRAAFDVGVFDDLPVAVLYFLGATMIDANLEWMSISRLGREESAGDGWLQAIHPDDRAAISECVATAATDPHVGVSVRVVGRDGATTWFRSQLRCLDDMDQARLLTLTSIGVHRSNEARLLHMSTHDGLTGLANRAWFLGRVARTLDEGAGLVAVLFIDLDNFKAVNDHLGHRFGDGVLRAVCKRIESAIRPSDLAGRLGGDEIGVFCSEVASTGEVFSLAERVSCAVATPFMIDAQTVVIDSSIGVAFTSGSCRTADVLIETADRAMYAAKAAGGGRWATVDAAPTRDGSLLFRTPRRTTRPSDPHC